MSNELPNDPRDAIGLIIELRPGPTKNTQSISCYGTGQYVIDKSDMNEPLVGNGLTFEEILRVYPLEEYDRIDKRVHGLLFGKGVYDRLKAKFWVVGKI